MQAKQASGDSKSAALAKLHKIACWVLQKCVYIAHHALYSDGKDSVHAGVYLGSEHPQA